MERQDLNFGDHLSHAMVIWQGDFVHIDDPDYQDNLSSIKNHETEIIRKDLYDRLSKEAKFVINFILQAPAEIIEELQKVKLPGYQNYYNGWMQTGGFKSTEETAVFKKERIASYLRKIWGRKLVRAVITELETYAKELGKI